MLMEKVLETEKIVQQVSSEFGTSELQLQMGHSPHPSSPPLLEEAWGNCSPSGGVVVC